MNISILLPTIWRIEQAIRYINIILSEMRENDEILIVTETPEITEFQSRLPDPRVVILETSVKGYWRCLNVALPKIKNRVFMWTADDAYFHPKCLEIARKSFESHFPDGIGVLATNDLILGDAICGHAMTTRDFLYVLFGKQLFPEDFWHLFLDTMIADWAKTINRFYYEPEAIVEHMHYAVGKSEKDALYRVNEGGDDATTKNRMDKVWYKGGGKEGARGRIDSVKGKSL